MLEKFYSTKETAEILGVTARAVEKWRLEGKLRPVKAGKLCRYPESEIGRFLGLSADGTSYANENVDEKGNSRGELAEAQKLAVMPMAA
jgi:excisionase family DNA binding protein